MRHSSRPQVGPPEAGAEIEGQDFARVDWWGAELDGVTFASRHGDDLALWAVFERADDSAISRTLDAIEHHALSPEHADVQEAFRILGLSWSTH